MRTFSGIHTNTHADTGSQLVQYGGGNLKMNGKVCRNVRERERNSMATFTKQIQIRILKEAQKRTSIDEQVQWFQSVFPNEADAVISTDCTAYLMDAGHIDPSLRDCHGYSKGGEGWWGITLKGEEYLSQLEHPVWYWVRSSPPSPIAIIIAVAVIVSAVAGILNYVK